MEIRSIFAGHIFSRGLQFCCTPLCQVLGRMTRGTLALGAAGMPSISSNDLAKLSGPHGRCGQTIGGGGGLLPVDLLT